jgi:serine/threonine-protein kinase CHEK2
LELVTNDPRDRVLELPTISNRHFLLFNETKDGDNVAVLQDLSSNGTFVNEVIVGRNKQRELREGDEIAILDQTRFIFRYPNTRDSHGFRRQYRLLDQLGRGHFATVYLCIEKSTGNRYAVKKFDIRPGEASKMDGLRQEIAVLMSVSHPNVLCLKDSFEESDGMSIILELAPEGELFNWIVMKKKLTEEETRKIFIQLFQGIKYLVSRLLEHADPN